MQRSKILNNLLCYLVLSWGLFVFASCSAESQIILNPDLSGQAQIDIRVSPILFRYYQDLTGNYSSDTVFDPGEIRFELEQRRAIDVSDINLTAKSSLELSINFGNINTALRTELAGAAHEDFVTLENMGAGRQKLSLNLSEANIRALLSLGPISNNVLSEYLLPAPGSSEDPASYRDDLVWALEEYEDSTELGRRIDSSEISFIIILPSQAVSVSGGVVLSDAELYRGDFGVKFSVPILNLLTMSIHKEYFVIY